jgi:DNA-binding PadR family transcriptional regulator
MNRKIPRPDDSLPLHPQVFHVLLALGEDTFHGYGIIQAFEALMGGRETLLPGSLYGTLSRMVNAGLIEEVDSPPAQASGGPPRRYYRATAYGRKVARAESERMERLLAVARARKLAPGEVR